MPSRTDDYNRADSAVSLGTPSDGGSAWTAFGATYGISSNRAYTPTAATAFSSGATLESGAADADVQATTAGANGADVVGLVSRFSDSSNHFLMVSWAGAWRIYRRQAGSLTAVGSAGTGAASAGTVLKLSVSGSTLKAYVGGTLLFTVTDSFNQAATQHGILINNSSSVFLDDFSATDTGGGGGTPQLASAALVASCSLTADATAARHASASLAGAPGLSADATIRLHVSASLAGTFALAADAALGLLGAASLVGTAALDAEAIVGLHADATLAGLATLTADATVGSPGASATLAATSTLAADATAGQHASSLLFSFSGFRREIAPGTFQIIGATVAQHASASLASSATLAADASLGQHAAAGLACEATVTADAILVLPGASASLVCSTKLTADATLAQHASASLAGSSGLSGSASMPMPASATLAAVCTLAADASVAAGTVYDSLLSAFVARVNATPDIADNLPGGFWSIRADDDALDNLPFGVLRMTGTLDRYNTSGRIGYDAFLQVSLFGDAEAVHQRLRPAFLVAFAPDMDPLPVAGESFQACHATGGMLAEDVARDQDAEPVYHQVLLFTVLMGIAR